MNPHCRIGRVRPKAGGLVETPDFSQDAELTQDLRKAVYNVLDWWGHSIKGYYLIVWDEGGDMTTACRIDPKQIPPHLLPSYIAEIVRDRTVSEMTAHDVVDGRR